jgi:alpha-beta hydrolase superfamily lysophospholipase
MQTLTETITMSDDYKLVLHFWMPDNKPEKIVVLHHGMAEHSSRYAYVAQKLTDNNIALFAHDMRGHGESAEDETELGYLSDKDGFNKITEDLHFLIKEIKNRFPGIPVFLLGHSFGSFVSQNFMEKHGTEINGCILSGTAGPRIALGLSLYITSSLICLIKGKKARSKFLTWCSFGSYNKHFPDSDQNAVNWISSDKNAVKEYMQDKFCGYMVTNAFYRDLGYGLSTIHLKHNMKKIPQNLPVFIFCGTEDPVGNYTKTVKHLYQCYKNNGMTDVSAKYYSRGRHEMFNEVNKDEVISDVINWIKNH